MYPKCPLCGKEMKPYYIKLEKDGKIIRNMKSIYFYCDSDGTLAHEETDQEVSVAGYGDFVTEFVYDLPEGYEPDITEAQEYYIACLAEKLHIDVPYVVSKKYASQVIQSLLNRYHKGRKQEFPVLHIPVSRGFFGG